MGGIEDKVIVGIIGSLSLILLSLTVILFFVFYQRKIMSKQKEIAEQEIEHQKSLTYSIIKAKEVEQRRIAQELHDEIGSQLTTLKMKLTSVLEPTEDAGFIQETLRTTIQSVRRISNELLPSVLAEFGLIHALKNLITTINKLGTIDANYHSDLEEMHLSSEKELNTYRIVQEVVNNILKYAEAQKINIDVIDEGKNYVIAIKDDGIGFIPSEDQMKKPNSLGMKNIQSRLQIINGTIDYQLNKSKGTTVKITCPK